MKIKAVFFLVVALGSILLTNVSCSNGADRSSNDGEQMDSLTMAQHAKDAQVLSDLKNKKLAAEQEAEEAILNTKHAKRIERDAIDAADQADQAYRTEEKAQKSRQQANDQAEKAEKASNKANAN